MAIHTWRVRAGGPPFPIGPGWWLGLGLLALGVLVVRPLRRSRTRPAAATPWGTTHGPLT